MLKITAYAQKLIDDLDDVDFLEKIKVQQKNWIGRSEGAEVNFKIANMDKNLTVYTTRPDTLFGATYMVISPEHPILKELEDKEASLDNKEKNDEKVMILFGAPGSVMIGTDKSYTGNLVQICGGNNVFSEGNSSYIQVNMEEIIKANPDKILVTMHALPEETKKTVAEELAKDSWKSINAVKNNKVIYLDSEYFGMSANLKVIEALDLLGDILYEQ